MPPHTPAYRVEFAPAAARQFERFDSGVQQRLARRIAALAENSRPPGCEKMTGCDLWRIRVGRFRIVYAVFDAHLLVLVVKIGDRKEVYR